MTLEDAGRISEIAAIPLLVLGLIFGYITGETEILAFFGRLGRSLRHPILARFIAVVAITLLSIAANVAVYEAAKWNYYHFPFGDPFLALWFTIVVNGGACYLLNFQIIFPAFLAIVRRKKKDVIALEGPQLPFEPGKHVVTLKHEFPTQETIYQRGETFLVLRNHNGGELMQQIVAAEREGWTKIGPAKHDVHTVGEPLKVMLKKKGRP